MYLGIDVSKNSITACLLDGYPTGGLLSFLNSTDNKTKRVYYKFSSSTDAKTKRRGWPGVIDFIQFCIEKEVKIAALEPTGIHYSKIWAFALERAGVEILWVGHAPYGVTSRLKAKLSKEYSSISSLEK